VIENVDRPLLGPNVAIIGFSEGRKDAPWEDAQWSEKWICNRLGVVLEKENNTNWTRHFDPHQIGWTKDHFSPELYAEYLAFLIRDHGERILYHPSAFEGALSSSPFPLQQCLAVTRRKYLTCAISYQIAYAIFLGAEKIGLWGIDLREDTEYGYERPNVEWLLGLADGRGVDIVLPDGCALLNNDGNMPLYGVEETDTQMADMERMLSHRHKDIVEHIPKMRKENDELLKNMYIAEGARVQTEIYLDSIRRARRGGKIYDVPKIGIPEKE